MLRLRPHHLLCMLTFAGEGYTPAFTENFQRIAELIAGHVAAGPETVMIVDGPDDVCAPLLCNSDCHCHNPSVVERDRLAALALAPLLNQGVHAGAQIILERDKLDRMRAAFAQGTVRAACKTCPWSGLCDSIAANGFVNTALLRSAVG